MKNDNIAEIRDNYYKNYCNGYYLLGVNLKKSNIEYFKIENIFFNAKSYKKEKLLQTKLYDEIDSIDDIDLSDNDFSNSTWCFDEFLYEVLAAVKDYVDQFYYSEFLEIKDAEDLENTSTYVDESYIQDLYNRINKDIAKIINKLIPNLKNTKLKIRFKPERVLSDMSFVDKIITDILNSGKFDGCYLDFYYSYNLNFLDKKKIEGYKEPASKNVINALNSNNTSDIEENSKVHIYKRNKN